MKMAHAYMKNAVRSVLGLRTALVFLASAAGTLGQPQQTVLVGPPPEPGANLAFVTGALVPGAPVKGAPYSAESSTTTTQMLADGNRIVTSISSSIFRDGEGRERREQSLPAIGPFAAQDPNARAVFISDPVAGVAYSLIPDKKIAMRLPAPLLRPAPAPPNGGGGVNPGATFNVMIHREPGPGASFGIQDPQVMVYRSTGPGANPPKVEQLGSKVIAGVAADGVRKTVIIPAGQIGNDREIQIVDEQWRSPDLQVIVASTHSDPRTGTTEYALTNIVRGEPSPDLFQVPPDYTIQDGPALQKIEKPGAPRQ
jgi:hypothetical protein